MIFVRVQHDATTPALRRLLRRARDTEPVLRAMGNRFLRIAKSTFHPSGARFRPKPWPNKKDGSVCWLRKTQTLSKSFFLRVTPKQAAVSTPVRYAPPHQFGAPSRGLPARPFYPVTDRGTLTPMAEGIVFEAGRRVVERQLKAGP